VQREIVVKSRSLGGTSDLTLLAPIKRGFIDSLESISYKTRIKRTLDVLHGARMASHEYAPARLLSDAVERVGVIHSVRVAVFEPEDKVLLAVTFDGSWESYIRVLWDKVGTLLDLIFCSTEGYVTAHDHTFEEWLAWARRVQQPTGFFYGPPDFTARDAWYHRRVERMRQRGVASESDELLAVLPTAEENARTPYGDRPDDAPPPPIDEYTQVRTVTESAKAGLQALAGLYRLTELFRPDTADGHVLRLASVSLLEEFVHLCDRTLTPEDIREARKRFARPLDWLFPGQRYDVIAKRPTPAFEEMDAVARTDIQGGILENYEGANFGLLVLLAFDDAQAARSTLEELVPELARASQGHAAEPGAVYRNLAFTAEGLRRCGLADDELELFPEDFRQGMSARAGLLGDVRNNHPRRWRLPPRFAGAEAAPAPEPVSLEAVHAVLQLRCRPREAIDETLAYWDPRHPLQGEIERLIGLRIEGLRVLAVQAMQSRTRERAGQPAIVEHFGYVDGLGQPELSPAAPAGQRSHVGEVVIGYNNAADTGQRAASGCPMDPGARRMAWLANGSFLVLRKYRQNVGRFEAAIAAAAEEMARETGWPAARCREEVYAKLMGRYRDGRPLVGEGDGPNAFTYESDPRGEACPLHAHIRRANPRSDAGIPVRRPRLMRRSMTYGPPPEAGDAERGLVFMAYNASLSEQFEVIQQWLAGGNSTGTSSGQSCPIVGVPENGQARNFRFVYGTPAGERVLNVELDPQPAAFEEPETVTRLDWGLYLFTPAFSVLERLARRAAATAGAAGRAVPWDIERGRALIRQLAAVEVREGAAAAVEAWKFAIEDPDAIDNLDSAALWAAIRDDHGGVLRTPYGVLVANRALVSEVYTDRERYSVCGQRERMKLSIGDISLGKDWARADGDDYEVESAPVNAAIARLDVQRVYQLSFSAATAKLDTILADALKQARDAGATQFDTTFDARELLDEVLADLSEDWFGIEAPFFQRGSADWAWTPADPPLYPGHFTALSRYMFQPNPGPAPVELGQSYGRALRAAMLQFVRAHRAAGTLPKDKLGGPAPIAAATFGHAKLGADDDFVASTMVGVLMGFTPTIIGAVLNVLREWRRDGSFAQLRAQCAGQRLDALPLARRLLHTPMAAAAQMRPMPQIGWRTVRVGHRLGEGAHAVDLQAGDKVVMAMVGATQQSLADGQPDGRLMFGGVREQPAHPTHACPGYHQGIAAMLGALAAVVGRSEDIRHGLAPLTFEARGATGVMRGEPEAA
jgi:Dyp-type peroxidase family